MLVLFCNSFTVDEAKYVAVLFSSITCWDAQGFIVHAAVWEHLLADDEVSITTKSTTMAVEKEGLPPTNPRPQVLRGWVGCAEPAVQAKQCVSNPWVDLQSQWTSAVAQNVEVIGDVVGQCALAFMSGGEQCVKTFLATIVRSINVHNVEVVGLPVRAHDNERCGEAFTVRGLQSHVAMVNGQVDRGAHSTLSNDQEWSNCIRV